MHLNKEEIGKMLRSQGEHDKAHQAETVLPNEVDTELDAGLLQRLEINTGELTRRQSPAE